MVGDGHAALDADPNPLLRRFRALTEQTLQQGHAASRLDVSIDTLDAPERFQVVPPSHPAINLCFGGQGSVGEACLSGPPPGITVAACHAGARYLSAERRRAPYLFGGRMQKALAFIALILLS